MKFCQFCGTQLEDDALFCVQCGSALNTPVQSNPNTYKTPNSESKPINNGSSAIVLGVLGIIFAWVYALIGHVISIIGIVMGAKEYKATGKTTGLALCIMGEVCAVLNSVLGALIATGDIKI